MSAGAPAGSTVKFCKALSARYRRHVGAARTRRPRPCINEGSQTRFCYVDGMLQALARLMDSRDDFRGLVNAGGPGA